jgi:hypothetical protein
VKHAGTVQLSEGARRAALSSARVFWGCIRCVGLIADSDRGEFHLVSNAASSNGRDVRIIDQQTAKHWQPDGPAVPVVPHRQVTAAAAFQLGPPVSVLNPIGGSHPPCPVVGPGDHLLAIGGT